MRPVLILGGGPAGAAAAAILAGSGRSVTLIERSAGPVDKVCGDFLSAEAIVALRALGLDLNRLSPVPVRRLRLLHGHRVVETTLPFAACGLTRKALDEALLDLAAARGARIERGYTVRNLRENRGTWTARADGLGDIAADTVFLATGKHDLRGMPRPGRADGSVGLKMYLRLAPRQDAALQGTIELVLFGGGYAGLQHVEGGRAVLCLTMAADRLKATGVQWPGVQAVLEQACPHVADRLADAEPLLEKPLAIAGTPYGFLYRPERGAPRGLFRLGDQACVIPSLTGDGVSIALHSARLAADFAGSDGSEYHCRLRKGLLWQMRLATVLQRGCVRPWGQTPLLALARLWPSLPGLAARWTRLRVA
jgi:flavin-dependent dehydrogenase